MMRGTVHQRGRPRLARAAHSAACCAAVTAAAATTAAGAPARDTAGNFNFAIETLLKQRPKHINTAVALKSIEHAFSVRNLGGIVRAKEPS
jgi:hypothetical protein